MLPPVFFFQGQYKEEKFVTCVDGAPGFQQKMLILDNGEARSGCQRQNERERRVIWILY